jgi:hypothetical protein
MSIDKQAQVPASIKPLILKKSLVRPNISQHHLQKINLNKIKTLRTGFYFRSQILTKNDLALNKSKVESVLTEPLRFPTNQTGHHICGKKEKPKQTKKQEQN